MEELRSHEKKAQAKAKDLATHKRRQGQLAEELAAAIADDELSQPLVTQPYITLLTLSTSVLVSVLGLEYLDLRELISFVVQWIQFWVAS